MESIPGSISQILSKVVIIKCDSYEYETVLNSVRRGIDLLGGASRFAEKDENILLKPNLLAGAGPEKCVCTHPVVFKAVGEIFKSTGAKVTYGDSSAWRSTLSAAKKSGLLEAAGQIGIELADFSEGQDVIFEEALQNKKLVIAKTVLESDGLISLPKLKTHGFVKFTGCIKNQFGCVPGLLKGEYHVKLANAFDFAKMLVDIDRFVKPRLYIMDGILAMEGNGPQGGSPRPVNVLLFSEDPVALDATACRLINLDPELVPTVKIGGDSGHGVCERGKIELAGDGFDEFIVKDFVVDRNPIKIFKPAGYMAFVSNRLVAKPAIDRALCIRCGLCVDACPVKPKALTWKDDDRTLPPVYDYGTCIRCYCCQEMCPEKAIRLKKPILRRLFNK
jgi:uncharacterized protein (DUF362 family)/NAD-dependent dihydropyrimidine dehydrogenase PreA subunit